VAAAAVAATAAAAAASGLFAVDDVESFMLDALASSSRSDPDPDPDDDEFEGRDRARGGKAGGFGEAGWGGAVSTPP
jgi:hypothetical protein